MRPRHAGFAQCSATAALAAALVLPTGAAQASKVYRWTDAAGNVQYGDIEMAAGARINGKLLKLTTTGT